MRLSMRWEFHYRAYVVQRGITFATSPAVTVEEFDAMMAEL